MIIRTPSEIGALIREHRNLAGLDQAQLAKLVGVSRKWIVDVERGNPGASLALVLRTLRSLKIALDAAPASRVKNKKEPAVDSGVDLDAFIDSFKRPKHG
jgi:HTH-type transcriptional regulator / antitoxin HipB